jgi:hypothetical protein
VVTCRPVTRTCCEPCKALQISIRKHSNADTRVKQVTADHQRLSAENSRLVLRIQRLEQQVTDTHQRLSAENSRLVLRIQHLEQQVTDTRRTCDLQQKVLRDTCQRRLKEGDAACQARLQTNAIECEVQLQTKDAACEERLQEQDAAQEVALKKERDKYECLPPAARRFFDEQVVYWTAKEIKQHMGHKWAQAYVLYQGSLPACLFVCIKSWSSSGSCICSRYGYDGELQGGSLDDMLTVPLFMFVS